MDEVEVQVTLKRKDYFKLFGMVCAANIATYCLTVVCIGLVRGSENNES